MGSTVPSLSTIYSNSQKIPNFWSSAKASKETTLPSDSSALSEDPAKRFPTEVVELIFKNFSGREMIHTVSLVSPAWNTQVMSSTRCMNKIRLKINLRKFSSSKRSDLLKGTMRTYQHISIKGYFLSKLTGPTIDAFAAAKGSWKSVSIEKVIFPNAESLNETFEIFEASVETLVIKYARIGYVDAAPKCFPFNQLTSLTMDEPDLLVTSAFLGCSALKKLDYIGEREDYFINTIIRNQKRLRYLNVN